MEPLQFKLDPLQYPALQKKAIIRSVSSIAILLTVISVYMLKDAAGTDWVVWIVYIIVMTTFFAISIFRSSKKRKKIYESYTITIDGHAIKRVQDRWKDLYIPIVEITNIEKKSNGNFAIKASSNNPLEKINIPKQIENYEEFEQILAGIKPITLNPKIIWWEKYGLLLSLAFGAPLLLVYLVDNKIVVGICAALSVAVLAYSFFNILKYRHTVKGMKRALWILPILLGSILLTAYYKLIA